MTQSNNRPYSTGCQHNMSTTVLRVKDYKIVALGSNQKAVDLYSVQMFKLLPTALNKCEIKHNQSSCCCYMS